MPRLDNGEPMPVIRHTPGYRGVTTYISVPVDAAVNHLGHPLVSVSSRDLIHVTTEDKYMSVRFRERIYLTDLYAVVLRHREEFIYIIEGLGSPKRNLISAQEFPRPSDFIAHWDPNPPDYRCAVCGLKVFNPCSHEHCPNCTSKYSLFIPGSTEINRRVLGNMNEEQIRAIADEVY